jgi:hypothetical protein
MSARSALYPALFTGLLETYSGFQLSSDFSGAQASRLPKPPKKAGETPALPALVM